MEIASCKISQYCDKLCAVGIQHLTNNIPHRKETLDYGSNQSRAGGAMDEKPQYVILIDDKVKKFIKKLSAKEQTHIARKIDLLKEFGISLGEPHVKKIKDNLWEFRARCDKKAFRFFFAIEENHNLNFVHAFHKTSDDTPKKDKKLAIKRSK